MLAQLILAFIETCRALIGIWGMAEMWSCENDLIRNSRGNIQLLFHRLPPKKSMDVTLSLDVAIPGRNHCQLWHLYGLLFNMSIL